VAEADVGDAKGGHVRWSERIGNSTNDNLGYDNRRTGASARTTSARCGLHRLLE